LFSPFFGLLSLFSHAIVHEIGLCKKNAKSSDSTSPSFFLSKIKTYSAHRAMDLPYLIVFVSLFFFTQW